MKSENYSPPPFNADLQPAEKPWLKNLESDPNLIIRVSDKYVLCDEELFQQIKRWRNAYQELGEKFKINLPKFNFTVGDGDHEETNRTIYTVTERIFGYNLEKLPKEIIDQELLEKVDQQYSYLVNYYIDRYQNGGDFLTDIDLPRQYIYGRKSAHEQADLFLIDLDPFISTFGTDIRDQISLLTHFYNLANSLLLIESKAILGRPLAQARQTLINFLESIQDNFYRIDLAKKIIADLKEKN